MMIALIMGVFGSYLTFDPGVAMAMAMPGEMMSEMGHEECVEMVEVDPCESEEHCLRCFDDVQPEASVLIGVVDIEPCVDEEGVEEEQGFFYQKPDFKRPYLRQRLRRHLSTQKLE